MTKAEFAKVHYATNVAIHQLVFACNHSLNDDFCSARTAVTFARINLDRLEALLL